jgi:nonsense-mediated mRNA decay protein 3
MSSSSVEFCPRCGADVPDREEPLPGDPRGRKARLCDDCYFADFDLVDAPEELVVAICSGCGAVRRNEQWHDLGEEDYTDVAVDAVRESLGVHVDATGIRWGVEPEQVDENTLDVHCEFSGVVRGTEVEASHDVQVQFARERCQRCSKIAGNSYASTVQVRAAERTPTDGERAQAVDIATGIVATREEKGDRNAYITEINEGADGVDVRLSTNRLGRTIAGRIKRRLGGSVSDSRTLVTEDGDGNEVYRVAYAVRLPPYPAGTVIEPEGEDPVLVRSAHGNLKGQFLTTGERYEADSDDGLAPPARRLGHVEDARETTLVAVEDERAVQVLDPETYETATVARPSYLDPGAETVYVLKHRDGLLVLPDDAAEGEE